LAVAFLKHRSEALNAFKQFKALAEKQVGHKVQVECDDKGGEFISKKFDDFCAEHGIARQHSEPTK
jgi:hypothetical protein